MFCGLYSIRKILANLKTRQNSAVECFSKGIPYFPKNRRSIALCSGDCKELEVLLLPQDLDFESSGFEVFEDDHL